MSREVHVRICGGLVVRFLRSTRASCSPPGRTATGTDRVVRGPPRPAEGGGLAPEPVGARKVGACPLPWCRTSWRAWAHRARAQGRWARGSSRRTRTVEGRGTRERPWQHTKPRRGVGEAALKLRAIGAGDRRAATVSTGVGKAHRPGAQGGLRKRGPGWHEAPTSPIERARAGNSPPTVVRAADLSRPAQAAWYALLEKRGIIRLSVWRFQGPGSGENTLRGLCWGLTVLPLIHT
jgi:hypothetical protein